MSNVELCFKPKKEEGIRRQTVDFSPSAWGDYFVAWSPPPSTSNEPRIEVRHKELKMEVKAMLKDDNDAMRMLSLINDIQQLGLEYHFEREICELLRHIQDDDDKDSHDNLHITALRFRLLRQHGYHVSSDVFKNLKDRENRFKRELSFDAKGLLYLYEATWLGTRGETILDEAMDFTTSHMEHLISAQGNAALEAQIVHAVEMPTHRGMRRLEARHSIEIYNADEARSCVLLELAKMDFNLLQALHQAEIKAISIWWRGMGLVEKLSFARDRVVECYFWSLGVHFEPQYSCGRILLTKLIALASVMDDMFDAYGTLEELRLFTDVVQRWDHEDVGHLPEYMIVYLTSFVSVIREIEDLLINKGMRHHMHYMIESVQALVRAYFQEAEWASNGYMPTLEEYLEISVMSSGYPMLICASLIVMEEETTRNVLDLALNVPKAIEASALIARLMDDLVSTKLEQERKHVASSVQCYANDHKVPEEVAYLKISEMVAESWKDLNDEFLKSCPSLKHLNMTALNFARMIEVIYKHEDGYTNPLGKMKDNIALLLVKPI